MSGPPSGAWRKPVGTLAIIALIVMWCVAVASLSGWVGAWPWWGQLPFYVVAGIGWLWVLPLKRLLFWMEHGRFRTAATQAAAETKSGPASGA